MFALSSTQTLRIIFFSYLLFVVFVVTSCSNNNNGQDPGVITTDCVNNPSFCQSNVYNQTPGFAPYQQNNGFNNGYNSTFGGGVIYNSALISSGSGPFRYLNNAAYLCNCPVNYVPTYNNYNGLGCVQSGAISGSGYAFFTFSTNGSNNNQWVNIPQISNVTGYTNQGCYNGVVQSCIVTDPTSCSTNFVCRPTSAASALGMCVSNGANSQTSTVFR